jgi:hypothetical protein
MGCELRDLGLTSTGEFFKNSMPVEDLFKQDKGIYIIRDFLKKEE